MPATVQVNPPVKSNQLIRTFNQFRDAIWAYRRPRVLLTALDLDLFTVMGARAWKVAELSRRLRVSPRGLEILCRNLATAGLLVKRNTSYRSSPLAFTELNARSRRYRGAYIELMRNHWEDWSKLTEVVRKGEPVDHEKPDDPAYRRRFSWAMHHRSTDVAPRVAAHLDLRDADTLLDLGGGPGTYALAFLARHPKLRATVCDRAPALEVARKIAAGLKHGRRLAYLPLDFTKQPIPGHYDVVWYSNVLHIYSPEENRRVFRKIASALTPQGRLLIQDAFLLDREGLHPPEANLFAVTMLLFTETGNTYRLDETARWLKEAGFGNVRLITLGAGTGDWEGGVLEASRPPVRPGSRARRPESARH